LRHCASNTYRRTKTFALLAQGPLEEMRRLQSEMEQLTAEIAAVPTSAA